MPSMVDRQLNYDRRENCDQSDDFRNDEMANRLLVKYHRMFGDPEHIRIADRIRCLIVPTGQDACRS